MAETESVPPKLDAQLQRYAEEGFPGKVNDYLKDIDVERHLEVTQTTIKPEGIHANVIDCASGHYAVMNGNYNKHHGEHWFWTCVQHAGME